MIRLLFLCAACFTSACFAAEDGPHGDSPAVTPEASANKQASPRRWLATSGVYFERQDDGRWIEFTQAGAVGHVFEEDQVTPASVELVDRSRNMGVLLQDRTAWWRIDAPQGPWNLLARGAWQAGAAPEAVERADREPEIAPRTAAEEEALAKAIEEVERFIEVNPDAPLEMSHLKKLEPELAEVLVCTDDTPRTATRRVPVVRSVIVPVTIDGEPTEKIERQESFVERSVTIPGKVLKLNGLETLSPELAQILFSHVGELHLNGLTDISEEVATDLANGSYTLYLDGLQTLSDDAAWVLSRGGDVSLRGLKRVSRKAFDMLYAGHIGGNRGMGGFDVPNTTCWLPRTLIIEDTFRHGPQVDWSEMPRVETFRNYLRLLSEKSETAIEIDEQALARQGISPDTTLASRLVGVIEGGLMHQSASYGVTFGFWPQTRMSVDRAVFILMMLLHNDPTVVDAGGRLYCFVGDEGLLVTDSKAIQGVLPSQYLAAQEWQEWSEEESKETGWLDSARSYRVRLPDGNEAAMSPVTDSFADRAAINSSMHAR